MFGELDIGSGVEVFVECLVDCVVIEICIDGVDIVFGGLVLFLWDFGIVDL